MKDVPTIDFQLYRVPGHSHRFELMLRGGDGVLQSLHRFAVRTGGDSCYELPVLVDGIPDLLHGQVVEMGVENTTSGGVVRFTSVQVREGGKQPNFLCPGLHPR